MKLGIWFLAALLAGLLTGCKQQPKDESLQLPKYKFEAEDFGVGRKHTANAACNRQIDAMLVELMKCYNDNSKEACAGAQEKSSGEITRLKNSVRCRH